MVGWKNQIAWLTDGTNIDWSANLISSGADICKIWDRHKARGTGGWLHEEDSIDYSNSCVYTYTQPGSIAEEETMGKGRLIILNHTVNLQK